MTASNTRQNLRLDVQGSENVLKAGGKLERFVTLENQGQQDAKINVWIEPRDRQSDLVKWVSWRNAPLVSLVAGTECEIALRFEVPATAKPGFYQYEIQAESTAYPGQVAKRSQQLEVLPSERYLEERNEPTFSVEPSTSSDSPHILQTGQALDVKILIENRSKQVERFSVSCPELMQWIQGKHQELPLLPEQSGTISLRLQPPDDAIAGNYSSTLRLNSHIHSNLTFLEILYLKLEVDDRLSLALTDETPPLPSAQKRFTIHIVNHSNIERPLEVLFGDGTRLFHYSWKEAQLSGTSGEIIQPPPGLALQSRQAIGIERNRVQFSLGPKQELRLYLTPKLTLKPWRRLWFGRDRQVPFNVELRNAHLDSTETLFLPEPQTGTLIWKPYPRWAIGLMILVPVLLLLGTLLSLGYWQLWEWIVKPSLMPKIAEFSTVEKTCQEETNTPIRLNWEVHNLGLLKEVGLTQFADSENKSPAISLPYVEDKSQSDRPYSERYRLKEDDISSQKWLLGYSTKQPESQQYCNIVPIPVKTSWGQSLWEMLYRNVSEMHSYRAAKGFALHCHRVITPATREGSHTFKIELEAEAFKSSQKSDKSNADGNIFTQNRTSENANNFVVRSFNSVIQFFSPAKDFIFNHFSSKESIPQTILADTKTIQGIQITSPTPGSIVAFSTKATIYREASSNAVRDSSNSPKLPTSPIRLNWAIGNPERLRAIELSWVQTGLDGKVTKSQKRYSLSDGLLKEIGCRSQDRLLICEDVPTNTNNAGQYTFTLTPIVFDNSQTPDTTKTIQNIQIRPSLPQIAAFAVNGKNAINTPKQVVVVNPALGSVDVALSWNIPNRDKMKVELLPAPGVIDPSRPPTLTYSLSPKSNNTMVLRVTNQVGETVERSVVIETTESVPLERIVVPSFPPLPQPPPPPNGAAPSGSPAKPPEKPEEFSPYELPPQTN